MRGQRRTFKRVERDIDLGSGALRGADFFTDIEHRRFIALTLTDHHGPVHFEPVERGAHCFDRSGIGGFFIAAPDQRRGADGGSLGHPNHFEDQHAV